MPRTVDTVMADARAASFTKRSIKTDAKLRGLLLAMSMIDLTTLEGKDSPEKVRSLCRKAIRPCDNDEVVLGLSVPSVAAICVYPALVPVATEALAGSGVRVASVATAFPSGQYPLAVRLDDTRRAIDAGADEIDMVINRGAFLAGRCDEAAQEIREVAAVCVASHKPPSTTETTESTEKKEKGKIGNGLASAPSSNTSSSVPSVVSVFAPPSVHLKVILETGELETYDNIRRASDLAIASLHESGISRRPGAAFIKTSTGKVQPAATLAVTLIMLEAIRDHFLQTGEVIGCKPAGGIRTAKQALQYLVMVKETMGGLGEGAEGQRGRGAEGEANPWLSPRCFRLGASSLANDILRQIFKFQTGRYMAGYDFAEA